MSRTGAGLVDAGPTFNGAIDGLVRPENENDLRAALAAAATGTVSAVLSGPAPRPNPIAANNPRVTGFNGLTHLDQRNAGSGIYTNTQFSLEPPDQALCVGAGFVVEAVNTAMAVYDRRGTLLAGPTALSQFFGLVPEFNRATRVVGDFVSDPKCYFDPDVRRWFLTLLQTDPDPPFRAHTLIAVSRSADPAGAWDRFSFDVTNDGQNGTPNHVGCPCFGDQPLIGANKDGFFITTNEFTDATGDFNGAQIYAMSKRQLASGTLPTIVHFEGGPLAEGISYSVQPATSPDGGEPNVEYFLSALQFVDTWDNRIALWAMARTETLSRARPNVSLVKTILKSEVYGQPLPATQKTSPTPPPLAALLGEPSPVLNTNDDRMNQAVFVDGLLWSGLNTQLADGRTGIAWFAVAPSARENGLRGSIFNQGYVSVAGNNVFFPSIGVNSDGDAVIAFSLSGPDFFPSAAYAKVSPVTGAGPVQVVAKGAEPADGFTGFPDFNGVDNVERWGDYSAAVADTEGNIWFATEYIPGGPRTQLANWGTFIGMVRP